MVNIQEVGDGIYNFKEIVPGIDITFSVYLVRGSKGIVIEPGPGVLVPSILDAVKSLGIKAVSYIIPTHIHLDHGGSVGELSGIFPEAKMVVHPRGARHLIDPTRLRESTAEAFGPDYDKSYGQILPVPESQVIVPSDGEVINRDDRELAIYYAPGHTPNHMVVLDRKTSGLFCGEALGARKESAPDCPIPSVAPPSFDVEECLATMERLLSLKPRMLYYSHDGVGREPESLIRCAMETTGDIGDIMLKSLNKGETKESTMSHVDDYLFRRCGIRLESPVDYEMLYAGYVLYFEKRGLIEHRKI